MNTLMYCLRCKAHWWSAVSDRCAACEAREAQKQWQEAMKIMEDDKEVFEALAKE